MTRIAADWLTQESSQRICALLSNAGHQVFFVGGCVRNTVIGAPVSDLDLTTDATPEAVQGLAEAAHIKCVPTGIDHGTVTLIIDNIPFEVTTFRRDVETDGRRATVAYSDTIEDDARRRDFTMNALYADPSGLVHDPLGGLPDAHAGIVRFIEDADRRIKEDYLRILRFFRFHAWYGDPHGGLDQDGLAACAANVDGIDGLSKERIGQELLKLLSADDPAPAMAAMAACGALLRVLPGSETSRLPPLVHIEKDMAMAPDPIRRLAVLGGDNAQENLRLSKADAQRLHALSSTEGTPAALGYALGKDAINRLAVRAAGISLAVPQVERDAAIFGAAQLFPISAADLQPELSGKALGDALKSLETRWIDSDFTLTRDDLLA